MKIFLFILAYLAHFSKQSIQIELSKLKETHPEFAEYLLNNSNSSLSGVIDAKSSKQPSYESTTELIFERSTSSSSRATPSAVTRFIYYNNETNSFEGVSMQSTYSVLSLGRNKTLTVMTSSTSLAPPFPSTTTATKPTTTQTVADNYLRQSTKIMDKISKSILPLYPQFVYSIRVVSLGESSGESYSQGGDLIEMLNGQSIDASKIRYNMIESLSSQLSVNQSELKLNWIDRSSKSAPSTNTNEAGVKKPRKKPEYDSSNSDYVSTLYHDSSSSYPTYSSEYPTSPDTDFDSQEKSGETSTRFTADYNRDQTVLVSFSSSRLYELQRLFLENLKHLSGKLSEARKTHYEERLSDLKNRFEIECERFFKHVVKKHESLKFRFKLSLLSNKSSSSNTQNEYLKKVQFLKLCDLNKIYTLFKNKQYEEANTYVKNSSEEIVFNAVRLSDDYERERGVSSSSKAAHYDEEVDDEDDELDDDNMMEEYGVTEVVVDDSVQQLNAHKVVKLKTEKLPSSSSINSTEDNVAERDLKATLIALFEKAKAFFWRHVPEEDFLLAVVVPVTIVVSLFVLTVVVACLLHIFNKDYRVRKEKEKGGVKEAIISTSNTTESTNSGGALVGSATATHLGTSTLDSRGGHHHHHHHKSSLNPIYKQRAYLSKGVPVILYEEMGDKPIEDYDENNADSTGGTSRLVGNYFRSPYIMRYEKPPMPAPPEYTRESLFDTMTSSSSKKRQTTVATNNNNDESVLNELRTMLSRDLDTSNLDYFGAAANQGIDAMSKSSPSSSASPAVIDSDDNVHLLASSTNHRYSSSPLNPSQTATAQNARQNLVTEIFLANARIKQQLNQISTYDDITTKHQLQKLLP